MRAKEPRSMLSHSALLSRAVRGQQQVTLNGLAEEVPRAWHQKDLVTRGRWGVSLPSLSSWPLFCVRKPVISSTMIDVFAGHPDPS